MAVFFPRDVLFRGVLFFEGGGLLDDVLLRGANLEIYTLGTHPFSPIKSLKYLYFFHSHEDLGYYQYPLNIYALRRNSDLKTKNWQWDPQTIVNNGVYLKIPRYVSFVNFLGLSLFPMTLPDPN